MENTAFEQGRRKLAEWQRGPERMIAGVCASMARQLEIPLPLVRGLFLVAAVVPSTRSAALLLYLALWFLTPPESGEPSGLDRVVNAVSSFGFGARRSESGAGQGGGVQRGLFVAGGVVAAVHKNRRSAAKGEAQVGALQNAGRLANQQQARRAAVAGDDGVGGEGGGQAHQPHPGNPAGRGGFEDGVHRFGDAGEQIVAGGEGFGGGEDRSGGAGCRNGDSGAGGGGEEGGIGERAAGVDAEGEGRHLPPHAAVSCVVQGAETGPARHPDAADFNFPCAAV